MVIGLVPTMGALHAGHISLVHRARKECGLIIASLFVNPIQFGANEDFDSYPRDQERDFGIFERNGVDIVYAPAIDVIYPDGFGVTVTVSKLTECLCGTKRPGHFDGVTTVVSKLFEHCQPDCAYFGEKDYQQLKVVEQMVNELDLPIRVVGAPVIRERDGLAMSLRNTYLNETERRIELLSGEAFFTVAKDPGRPFRVTANGTEAEALGTAFSVALQDNDARVAVTEHSVAVTVGGDRRIDGRASAVGGAVGAKSGSASAGVACLLRRSSLVVASFRRSPSA